MNVLQATSTTIANSWLFKLYRYYVIDSILIIKREGARALIRQRGKKFLIGIIAYYTVRDTLLYIVLPFCVAQGLFNGIF